MGGGWAGEGVWAGHVLFFTFVLGALPGVTCFLHVFRAPLFHLFFTFISPFFHVLRRLYVHVFFHVFFSRFP